MAGNAFIYFISYTGKFIVSKSWIKNYYNQVLRAIKLIITVKGCEKKAKSVFFTVQACELYNKLLQRGICEAEDYYTSSLRAMNRIISQKICDD